MIEKGSKVKVHYTGKFEDNNVFDTSTDKEPLEFTVGEGKLIPGFENGVMGLNTGEKTTIELRILEENGFSTGNLERAMDFWAEQESNRLEKHVGPHTKKFEEWLNKYFTLVDGKCYRTKDYKLYNLAQLHGKFKRAMKESPFVSG